MLKFSEQNAKTANLALVPALSKYLEGKRKIYSLDLASGFSCPGAKDCKSMAVMGQDGSCHIEDGSACKFRCFSASQEVLFPLLWALRQHNFNAIKTAKTAKSISKLIIDSLPKNAGIVRLHVGGDFFSLGYLRAMLIVAKARPDVLFYSYTKSLHHLKVLKNEGLCADLSCGKIMENFIITASFGGKYDSLIPELGVRIARVAFTESAAGSLPIDHDDSHAAMPGGDFVVLIHGTQPAGSAAGKAVSSLKGVGAYTRK